MSFKKDWDVNNICTLLAKCAAEVRSPYNDGFTAWECKKELYKIKFYLDDILDMPDKFSGESDFLEEMSKEKMLKILKKNDIQ